MEERTGEKATESVIRLPDAVRQIIGSLQAADHEAYAVGGCVRDSLLGRVPDDWDITTSATPQQIKAIFPRTIDTGIQHGTVTVMVNHVGYEVTTYRIDGEYEDGRHPKEVTFTRNLAEDLKRRDFTINAMAYNEEEGLIDIFGGRRDLEKGIIRCVGDPLCRFTEDALRMMRAVRFSAQLGHEIEQETGAAIRQLAGSLGCISAERIQVELVKLLISSHPDYLRKAWEMGLTAVFFPEFDQAMETTQNNPHHCYSVGEHLLHALLAVEPDKVLRLTMLLHDIGKPLTWTTDEQGVDHFHRHSEVSEKQAGQILRRLKFDNDTTNKVRTLVRFHDLDIESTPEAVRRAAVKVGPDLFESLLKVKQADVLAQSDYARHKKQQKLEELKATYAEVLAQKNCLSLKDLAVSGKDLMEIGIKPSRDMGDILHQLLTHVLEYPEDNQKEILLALVKK
jgi:tRNA nucleotidyltransferase (CCA-adding enzyme)